MGSFFCFEQFFFSLLTCHHWTLPVISFLFDFEVSGGRPIFSSAHLQRCHRAQWPLAKLAHCDMRSDTQSTQLQLAKRRSARKTKMKGRNETQGCLQNFCCNVFWDAFD